MKKLIALSFLMVALVALGAISVSAADDPIASYGTPVVDGIMDDMYTASTEIVADDRIVLWDDMATDVDPNLAQYLAKGSFRFVWDEGFLYCYFETKDTTPSDIYSGWLEGADAVRIYLDYNPEGPMDIDYRDAEAGPVRGWQAFITPKVEEKVLNNRIFGAALTSDGSGLWLEEAASAVVVFPKDYVGPTEGSIAGELKLPWPQGETPDAGKVIGFLAAVLDDTNGEDGIEYASFYGDHHDMDLESARKRTGPWDKLTLSDKTYTPPKTVSYGTPVFDGIMDDMYLASDELLADDRVTLADDLNVDADPALAQFIATASFRFMWDDEYLYCYFETEDITPSGTYSDWFEGADAVRIYVDYYPDEEDGFDFRDDPHGFNAFITPKSTAVMNNQVTGKQLTSDGAGAWLENMAGWAVKFDKNYVGPTEGSIAGEFRIAWDESMEPTAGHVLDVLCAALDDVDGEDGIEYYNWYGDTTEVDLETARKYCGPWNSMVLSDVTYVAPETLDEPTEQPPAQTLDAGIVVAVSVMAIAAGVVLTKKK